MPILGICYGLQFIVHHLGGKVRSAPKREYGHAEVAIEDTQHRRCLRAAADAPGLDEPRRRGARAARRVSAASRFQHNALAGIANRGARASGPCSFIPKCTTRRWVRNC